MMQKRLLFFSIALEFLINGLDCSCDFHQTVERDGTGTIRCTVRGSVEEHYWYQGSTLDSQPILRLENGNKGGTKYNEGHYDITDEGYMKIINAQIEHEAVYTFAVIFTNRSAWTQLISVSVTVTPEPPCPLILFCTGCDVCQQRVSSKTYTTLTCGIDEVRPKVALYWFDKNNKTLANESWSEVINPLTDTWNLSSSITFKLDSCGEQKNIYCNVQNDAGMSSLLNRSVNVYSEECLNWLTTVPIPETSGNVPVTLISVVCGSLLLSVGICLIVFRISRRNHISTQVNAHQLQLHKEPEVSRGQITNQLRHETVFTSRNTEPLETVLKLYWKVQLLGKGKEWYNNSRSYNFEISHNSNTMLYEKDVLDDMSLLKTLETATLNQRVLFLGEAGIGKTCLFRHIVRRWSKDEIMKDHILIYFQLERITDQTCLLVELQQMLSSRIKLDIGDIKEKLQNLSTIILLDGISNLSTLKHSDKDRHGTFNALNLFTDNNIPFPKMKVWVTCRKIDKHIMKMKNPTMTIALKDFDHNNMAINLEKFLSFVGPSAKATFCQIWNEIHIEDHETDETGESTPLANKHKIVSSKPHPLEKTIFCMFNKHFNNIDGGGRGFLTDSLMSRLLVLIYLNSNSKQEIEKKVKDLLNLPSEKVIKQFVQYKDWVIAVCLLEAGTENETEFREFAQLFHMTEIVFQFLEIDYHLQAVLHLLNALRVCKEKFWSLDICMDNPLPLVQYLPSVDVDLVFRSVCVKRKDFGPFIKATLKRSKNIQFFDSDIPNKPEILDVDAGNTVSHTKEDTVYLNFQEGKWESKKNDEMNANTKIVDK